MAPDFGLYFFGDYPRHATAADSYRTLLAAARHADSHGYSTVWIPERHFHSFGGIFPNPSVLAAAIAQATTRVRVNAGSVVLPLHDPIRVAEEWSVVDNLSNGRIGIGCAPGWSSDDFVFFPDRFGRHREIMRTQLEEVRQLWRGEPLWRTGGDGKRTAVSLHPRPIQPTPPMFAAVLGRRESYAMAARSDLGIVTNLMTQDVSQLAENIAHYRAVRAEHGLDPAAGRVAVLLHTYLAADPAQARRDAFAPLCSYLRASVSLFGQVTNSLGWNIDLKSATEDDLTYLFERAYDRYCDARALIGSPETCRPVVEALRDAGADEIASLVDFGMPSELMLAGLGQLDELRAQAAAAVAPLSPGQHRMWLADQLAPGNNSQNEPKAFRLRGALDVAALRAAADDLVARHEALRTVYRVCDGEPHQVVLPPRPAAFHVEDHTGAPEHEQVTAVIKQESCRRFDLSEGPLAVFRLLRLADDHHVLVLSMHHIAVDAVSARIITTELSELHNARVQSREPRLVAPRPLR
ncbi:MAG: MupA/Atu3671 family FMN-dependent luciferase-like monooxygenase, partial [Micromonosporaceae bacterium]